MSGPVRHREVPFVPIFIPAKGEPFFSLIHARRLRRDALDAFCFDQEQDWETLKKEGWRIVRVEVMS